MWTCKLCGEQKPQDQFYAGVKSRCKECHKAAVRANRAERIDYYRTYDRARADEPNRVELRQKRMDRVKTDPELRAHDNKRSRFWRDRNMVKRRAHVMVGHAIRAKRLVRPDICERCGANAHVDAHHESYYRPMEVTWLCEPCHGLRHREINEEIRNGADYRTRGF
tara:strand:+ start:18050 stop:18547 length:498 start_codon:yes stop_codon:yes gene_type:complete